VTISGAVAAWTVGASVLYGTGWEGGAVLAAFFVSSNLVSHISRTPPFSPLDTKGDRRDVWQVYANGGVAAFTAAAASGKLGIWLLSLTLAAATADTWATALGTWSGVAPRRFGFGNRVPPGSSGGMTLIGSAGAILGAATVSGVGAFVSGIPVIFPAGTLVGSVGMAFDSALGAVVQGRFYCHSCDAASEWRVHRCGRRTVRTAGLSWLDNDWVNFLTTGSAAGAGLLLWWWLFD
jgi:uncharacterized membrane protein